MTLSKSKFAITLLTGLTLAACSANQATQTSPTSSEQSMVQNKQVESATESTSTTKETTKEMAPKTEEKVENDAATQEQSSEKADETVTAVSSSLDISALANGDFSALVGTWTDERGNSLMIDGKDDITVSVAGVEGGTYRVEVVSSDTGVLFGGLVSSDGKSLGSFVVVPAGVATPNHGAVYQQDVICSGQSSFSELSPFFRALNVQ